MWRLAAGVWWLEGWLTEGWMSGVHEDWGELGARVSESWWLGSGKAGGEGAGGAGWTCAGDLSDGCLEEARVRLGGHKV